MIVLRAGSDTEMTSGFSGEEARLITDAPGTRDRARGTIASPELFVIVGHPLKRSGTDANVPLRGLTPTALKVRPTVKIVEGRMFNSGTNEIVVGTAASGQFAGLTVGSTGAVGREPWHVVGIFDAGGSVAESELWCDAKVLQPAYRRGNTYQSVYARLASIDSFQQFKDALTANPRLQVTVIREPDYYAAAVAGAADGHPHHRLRHRGADGLGAVFGAVNTMYIGRRQPHARDRHAAGARVRQQPGGRLGPGRGGPPEPRRRPDRRLVSPGLAFDGYQTSTMNFQSFSQVAFAFAVTPLAARARHVLRRCDGAARRPAPGNSRRPAAGRHRPAGALRSSRYPRRHPDPTTVPPRNRTTRTTGQPAEVR